MCVFLALDSFQDPNPQASAHSEDRHGSDRCSHTRHWKFLQLMPVVERRLPLLLIYYRLNPMLGCRVVEPPGHPPLQGSFQTTNMKETPVETFLLPVSKSSGAVKPFPPGIDVPAQK
jgi:hypothetical protein